MDKNFAFARELLISHGITEEPVRLSGGWTNSVFAAGSVVLRCTDNILDSRLLREIHLAKHRSGATDRIELTWVARYTKFSDKAL